MEQNHVWKRDDMALCEYIKGELAMGRILRVNENEKTADVLLYISGKKIKKISVEEMTLPLSVLSIPAVIQKITNQMDDEDEDDEEIAEI